MRLAPTFALLALPALLLAACAAGPGIPPPPEALQPPPLEFRPDLPETTELSNGIPLYLLPDRELPLVTVRVLMRVGSIYEPADKIGLAGLTGELLRTGGSEARSPEEIDDALEFHAIELSSSIGTETGEMLLDCRREDLGTGLEALAELLRQPRFDPRRFEVARQATLEGIRRRNDKPDDIVSREFARLVYGKDSPWGRIAQPDGIAALSREDLITFHERFIRPDALRIGVSGDFDRDELTALLERHFGDWQAAPVEYPELPPLPERVEPAFYVLERPLPQSIVRMGHLGYRRHSPDQLALTVFNEIFGTGGFSSRLMRELRTNRGLVYSTWGYIAKGSDRGLFQMQASTKAESTVEAMQLLRSELRRVVEGPIGEDEIDRAIESETNRFVFLFEQPSSVVSLQMDLDFYGYPEDWLANYLERLRAVDAEAVRDAARRHLHPERLVVVLAGDPEAIGTELGALGFGKPEPLALDPVVPSEP